MAFDDLFQENKSYRRLAEDGHRTRDQARRVGNCVQPWLLLFAALIGYGVFHSLGQTHEATLSVVEAWVDRGDPLPFFALAGVLTLFSGLFALAFKIFTYSAGDSRERLGRAQPDRRDPLLWLRAIAAAALAIAPWAWMWLAVEGAGAVLDAHRAAISAAGAGAIDVARLDARIDVLAEAIATWTWPLLGAGALVSLGVAYLCLRSFLVGHVILASLILFTTLFVIRAFDGDFYGEIAVVAAVVAFLVALVRRSPVGWTDWALTTLLALFLWVWAPDGAAYETLAYEALRAAGPMAAGVAALLTIVATLILFGRVGLWLRQPFLFVLIAFVVIVLAPQISFISWLSSDEDLALAASAALGIVAFVMLFGGGLHWVASLSLACLIGVGAGVGLLAASAPVAEDARAEDARADEARAEAAQTGAAAQQVATSDETTVSIEKAFRLWLRDRANQRADEADDAPYPVFIVAARGGGAYAAAASAGLLAKLECLAPGFHRHVFAVSGVSGGSVGATIFRDLMAAGGAQAQQNACPVGGGAVSPLEQKAFEVVAQNHVGSALGAFPTDIVRKMLAVAGAPQRSARAAALNQSFVDAQSRARFDDRRDPDAPLPNLLLNTTWSETGYRVAFTPFSLAGIGDGTLRSFQDLDADLSPENAPAGRSETPADAEFREEMRQALASATFPMVLPAHTRRARAQDGASERVWNFVDGGYSDSSGAATAIDLAEALHRGGEDGELPEFDLHLVLIGDGRPLEEDLAGVDGTRLRDTGAILSTIVNIRALLSNVAVRNAVDRAAALDGQGGSVTAHVVEVDPQVFALALGWSVSRTTAEVIGEALGRPEALRDRPTPPDPNPLCRSPDALSDDPDLRARCAELVLVRNSCALGAIAAAQQGRAFVAPACPRAAPRR